MTQSFHISITDAFDSVLATACTMWCMSHTATLDPLSCRHTPINITVKWDLMPNFGFLRLGGGIGFASPSGHRTVTLGAGIDAGTGVSYCAPKNYL